MTKWLEYRRCYAVVATIFVIAACAGWANAQPPSADEGLRVFKSANCVGCHKWTGEGGGGYGGAAANLRLTKLSVEEIETTIRCGRPTTGMPHFERDAYEDGRCYGLKKSDLPEGKMPPEPDHSLRPTDIKAVATYVVTSIKGKGDPDVTQCRTFFGTGSRVCDVYAKQGGADVQAASAAAPREGSKVDTAADVNAGNTLGK